ncbi:hypothetical protein [Chitinophaga qingshengii]|uniref:Polysaccharide biosynthesis protein C-terminal domain-containing protein n=1 Tax=Chitinophaga qingshengii TaxID=1569794 RepID=A0ABR7TVD8_9BACT|nr:hypothetical protein [Chitinophaga qingshengii]MBC9934462.1 hypothetical protein [Chitinophaga qingshengii]
MKLLLFVCKLKAVSLTKGRDNVDGWIRSFLSVLFLLAALLYGLGMGYLFRYLHTREHLTIDWLMPRLGLVLGVLTIVKGYFPDNVSFKPVFISPYPVDVWKKALIQLCYDLISPFFLFLLLFLGAFYLSSGTAGTAYFLYLVLCVVVFHLLERILKIQQSKKFFVVPALIAALVLAAIVVGTFWFKTGLLFLAGIQGVSIVVLVTLFINLYQRQEAMDGKLAGYVTDSGTKTFGQLIFTALIKKRPLWINLILSAVFKLFFGVLGVVMFMKNKGHVLTENIVLLAAISSPMLLFSYIFNNLFGYVPETYFMIAYIRSPAGLFRAYCQGIFKILLVDFVLSLVCCYFFFSLSTLIFVLLIYLDCMVLGFICSVFFPKKVTKAIDFGAFRSNTSIAGNVLLGLLVVGMSLLMNQLKYILLIQLVFTVVMLLIYIYWYKREMDKIIKSLAAEII